MPVTWPAWTRTKLIVNTSGVGWRAPEGGASCRQGASGRPQPAGIMITSPTAESPAARSGPLAFERAGVTPEEIDTCQIYDAFTSMVLQTFEGLGFCKKGEGGPFVADGRMRLDGALPTNTDGGGLSHCHPGMRGMFLLVEGVRQLRGEAHGRQVDDAKLCCVSGTGGWFSSSSTVILGVE